jgi:transcriptional regulator with XRE-family HTH domain
MTGRRMHAEFAERFRLALDEAGYRNYTLKKLATMFRVTPQAVRKWKEGESMPVSSRAPRVAELLGVRRAWLLDNELPMRAINTDMAELPSAYAAQGDGISISGPEFRLLANYRKLPRDLQDALDALADRMQAALPVVSEPAAE